MESLKEKGVWIFQDQFTYIRIFGFKGKPLILHQFVCDIFISYELCRKYNMWSLFFDKKRKQRFMPMPFKMIRITIKSSSSLNKIARYFEYFDMKETKTLNGFDPEGIFAAHMLDIGYTSLFNREQEISDSWKWQ
jgi:hypothetical protein